jgi:hypothetical protein
MSAADSHPSGHPVLSPSFLMQMLGTPPLSTHLSPFEQSPSASTLASQRLCSLSHLAPSGCIAPPPEGTQVALPTTGCPVRTVFTLSPVYWQFSWSVTVMRSVAQALYKVPWNGASHTMVGAPQLHAAHSAAAVEGSV